MKREREEETMKERLEEELAEIHFTGEAEVLRRTHPRTRRDKIRAFWNRELELPLLPIGAALILLLCWAGFRPFETLERHQASGRDRQLIDAGGNTYWKDDYERAVRKHEDSHQS